MTDLIAEHSLEQPCGRRKLNAAGRQAVDLTAGLAAGKVDELLGKAWSRRDGKFDGEPEKEEEVVATCSCGSGIPIQKVLVNEQEMTLLALPLIFQNFFQLGKAPGNEVAHEIMETVKIYNPVDAAQEASVEAVVLEAYASYCRKQKVKA